MVVVFGAKLSLGWTWPSFFDPIYKDVSNMIFGSYQQAALDHESLGRIYMDSRVVTGTTIDSPTASGSLAREDLIRSDYFKKNSNLALRSKLLPKNIF